VQRIVACAGAAILVAVSVLVRGRLAIGVEQARTQVTDAARELTADPESGLSNAGDGRFRARREVAVGMRELLQKLAFAESAFVAESGHPSTSVYVPVPRELQLYEMRSVVWGPSFWASITGYPTLGRFACWVYVGPDTTLSHSPSGVPKCAGYAALPSRVAKLVHGDFDLR
jgi:hypothetical protein